MIRPAALLTRPRLAVAALSLLMAGCATKGERVFVAPTEHTVTARLEPVNDGRGQHVIVENRSTVDIVVTGVRLSDCENLKNRCELTRMRRTVRPGQRQRVMTILQDNATRGHNFRYSWSWEAAGSTPVLIDG
jgi:hypothetical protein